MTQRIQGSSQSSRTTELSHAEPQPVATTPARQRSVRASAIIVEDSSRSASPERERVSRLIPARAPTQPTLDQITQEYFSAYLRGENPSAPAIPDLPFLPADEVLRRANVSPGDPTTAYRAAVRSARDNEVRTPSQQLMALLMSAFGSHSMEAEVGVEMAVHAAAETIHAAMEGMVGGLAEAAGLGGIAVDVAAGVFLELRNNLSDRTAPSHAVIETLRREIPIRLAREVSNLRARAERGFEAGVRDAAHGRPVATERRNDPIYAVGHREGSAYLARHGDVFARRDLHLRAMHAAYDRAVRSFPHIVTPTPMFRTPNADVRSVNAR